MASSTCRWSSARSVCASALTATSSALRPDTSAALSSAAACDVAAADSLASASVNRSSRAALAASAAEALSSNVHLPSSAAAFSVSAASKRFCRAARLLSAVDKSIWLASRAARKLATSSAATKPSPGLPVVTVSEAVARASCSSSSRAASLTEAISASLVAATASASCKAADASASCPRNDCIASDALASTIVAVEPVKGFSTASVSASPAGRSRCAGVTAASSSLASDTMAASLSCRCSASRTSVDKSRRSVAGVLTTEAGCIRGLRQFICESNAQRSASE